MENKAVAYRRKVTKKVEDELLSEFIAIDTETTGFSAQNDRIVELGAVRFVDGEIVERFSSLVNPEKKISSSASRVNHITNLMLMRAPSEEEAYAEFVRFLQEAMNGKVWLCAHNASFDFRFLTNTFNRLGIPAYMKYVDTLELCRNRVYGVRDYKQTTLAEYYGIKVEVAHRAAEDAEVCGKILLETIRNGRLF